MDLKLKDEITKLLIEEPGMSISELAKRTDNYYSYTHKLVSEMEKQGLLLIDKEQHGKRTFTKVRLSDGYKQEWMTDVKRFFKALFKNVELKTAFLLMYGFILINLFTSNVSSRMLAVESVAPPQPINFGFLIVIIIPVLLIIWFLRNKGSVTS